MAKLNKSIVVLGAKRTAFGTMLGALKKVSATDLAVHAAKAAIAQSGVAADAIGHVVIGNVMQTSPDAIYCARHVGLKAGLTDAASAINGLRLVSHVNKPDLLTGEGGARGLTFANSDLAFRGNLVFQGNFSGFQIWDISNPASPVIRSCMCTTPTGSE